MRRLLLTLMILVMLTPSLACAELLCCPQKREAQAKDMPCHEEQNQTHEKAGVKFMKDCTQVDLQIVSDAVALKKQADHSLTSFIIPETPGISAGTADVHGIRAPPRQAASSFFPPLYLSTLRLRI